MSLESIAGIVMVIALMGTVLSKYLCAVRESRLREHLANAESDVRKIRGELKLEEAEFAIVQRKESSLNKQVERLEKRIENNKKEIKKESG